ncbi:LacI family DNA-binding transcriptional regulator [Salinisphaera sp. Q1T1-3]|uniref:LacI family DNA-binding transcriptional regulator n=1 Tax=Salinisphaera sp. Q1T1-3 TaxID=2321229 RepID=UPI0018F485E8|nr:LacI family DNA-binding transcriptional regulator [Salinisphaera sp. Q1T1-3]
MPNSTDVARRAGVSQSAVSRTYSPGASVSQSTRDAVLAAAAELGYRPNALPGIMQGKRSRMIAVVIGGMGNPFYARVLDTLATRLSAAGQQMVLARVDSNHSLDAVADDLARYRVDGVFSALAVTQPDTRDALAAFGIPVVSFNTPLHGPSVHSVSCDNAAAGAAAAQLLHARGATRPAFIHGPENSPAEIERFTGFADAIRALGLPSPLEARGNYDYAGGRSAAAALMTASTPPDALFAANDLLALGALEALRHDLDRAVPSDVQVIGFDDIDMAAWQAFQLTSFAQDISGMVDRAVELLLSEQTTTEGQCLRVPARLIERATT